jgi:NADPH:quinone reductase-like Zn-dependent oxidoreductase
VRIPDALSFEHASVVTVAGLSALQMIERAAVRAGQRVLVHGAAGGVGSFAVPMLRDRGAFVVATGSATSQASLRELEPDLQVDYATDPANWPGPFDAILDCASRLPRALLPRLLPDGGAYVATLPSFPGLIIDPLFNVFRQRRQHALRLEPAAAQLAQVLAMVAEGRVPVRISRAVSFDRVLDALTESRGGHTHGKLVVAIG